MPHPLHLFTCITMLALTRTAEVPAEVMPMDLDFDFDTSMSRRP
jgi:hypothetical protein